MTYSELLEETKTDGNYQLHLGSIKLLEYNNATRILSLAIENICIEEIRRNSLANRPIDLQVSLRLYNPNISFVAQRVTILVDNVYDVEPIAGKSPLLSLEEAANSSLELCLTPAKNDYLGRLLLYYSRRLSKWI